MDPDIRSPPIAPATDVVEPTSAEPARVKEEAPTVDAGIVSAVTDDAPSKASQSQVPKFQTPLVFGQKGETPGDNALSDG